MTSKSTNKHVLGTLVLAIWALPGIGILPLLIFLQYRKRGKDTTATSPNKRGQYG